MKLKVGDKTLTIRKWKGKDKKAFVKAFKNKTLDENEIMNTLVYNCIEEDVVLSVDEFRYALSRIRAYSLGEDLSIDFYCEDCGTIHKHDFKIKDIIRCTYSPLYEIKAKDVRIKLGAIKNRDSYVKLVAEDELYDLLLRIDSINGDNSFTLDGLIEMFDDMDIDVLTDVLEQYESAKFKVDDINIVRCSNPECGKEVKYKFDNLPGFFPPSWF